MPILSAILFDIDDTLCATTEFACRARRNAVDAMVRAGVRADRELVYTELEEVIAEFSSNYEHHFDKLLLRLGPECVQQVNRSLVVAAGVAAYHDTKFQELVPFPGVESLLADLCALGVRLGVITHGLAVKQAEKLVRLRLVPHLDPEAIFISDEIGISKPNPKLYRLAQRRLGLDPGSLMYVGDNPRNDVSPPKALGWITVWARQAAKHSPEDERTMPHHTVASFQELRDLLRSRFALDLPAG